jgi:hypothetical protein
VSGATGAKGKSSTSSGLSFLALISFVTSFLVARVFATLNPKTVVVTGGVHLHHFWYGLAMISVAGWLAIGYNRPQFSRIYAIVFGLGAGLIGDEIGLLLTFGNYNSSLTFFFFIIVVAGGSIAVLLRDREQLSYDVFELGREDKLLYAGLIVAGLSALAFAADQLFLGIVVIGIGTLMMALGFLWHRNVAGKN